MHPSVEWLFGVRKQLKNILNTKKTVVSTSIARYLVILDTENTPCLGRDV